MVTDYAGTGELLDPDAARAILESARRMTDEEYARWLFPGQKGCVPELGVCLDGT